MTTGGGFTLEKCWRGETFFSFRGSFGNRGLRVPDEEGVEEDKTGEERVEDFEGDDIEEGGIGGESLGKRDVLLLVWDVGADLGGDLGMGAEVEGG